MESNDSARVPFHISALAPRWLRGTDDEQEAADVSVPSADLLSNPFLFYEHNISRVRFEEADEEEQASSEGDGSSSEESQALGEGVALFLSNAIKDKGGVSLWLQHKALLQRERDTDMLVEWGPDGVYEDETIKEMLRSAATRFQMRQQRRNRIDLYNDLMARLKQSVSFR